MVYLWPPTTTSARAAKTSGSVVAAAASGRTFTAPRRPWAPDIRPKPMRWDGESCPLLNDFQYRPLANFGGRGTQNGAHGPGGASLLADHLPKIFLGHLEFDN